MDIVETRKVAFRMVNNKRNPYNIGQVSVVDAKEALGQVDFAEVSCRCRNPLLMQGVRRKAILARDEHRSLPGLEATPKDC